MLNIESHLTGNKPERKHDSSKVSDNKPGFLTIGKLREILSVLPPHLPWGYGHMPEYFQGTGENVGDLLEELGDYECDEVFVMDECDVVAILIVGDGWVGLKTDRNPSE